MAHHEIVRWLWLSVPYVCSCLVLSYMSFHSFNVYKIHRKKKQKQKKKKYNPKQKSAHTINKTKRNFSRPIRLLFSAVCHRRRRLSIFAVDLCINSLGEGALGAGASEWIKDGE